MEEEMGRKEPTGTPDSTGTIAAGDSHAAEDRRGPTWRGWVFSILVAVLLSVTATLLLGGSSAFRSDGAAAGAGRSCCPPAVAGK